MRQLIHVISPADLHHPTTGPLAEKIGWETVRQLLYCPLLCDVGKQVWETIGPDGARSYTVTGPEEPSP